MEPSRAFISMARHTTTRATHRRRSLAVEVGGMVTDAGIVMI